MRAVMRAVARIHEFFSPATTAQPGEQPGEQTCEQPCERRAEQLTLSMHRGMKGFEFRMSNMLFFSEFFLEEEKVKKKSHLKNTVLTKTKGSNLSFSNIH